MGTLVQVTRRPSSHDLDLCWATKRSYRAWRSSHSPAGWERSGDTLLGDEIRSNGQDCALVDNGIRRFQSHSSILADEHKEHMLSSLLKVADAGGSSFVLKLETLQKGG